MKNRSAGRLGRLFDVVIPECFYRGSQPLKSTTRFPMTTFGNDVARGYLRGFTLIELLVVVLIIGVLSAVALPQYQKAVEKSRAAEALTNLRALVNAMQLSKMANGVPAEKLEDLDVSLPGEKIDKRTVKLKNFTYDIRNLGKGTEKFEVVATRNDATTDDRKYYIYFSYQGSWACVAKTEAAKVPCSAVCARSDFGQRDDGTGYFICYIHQ